MRYNIIRTEMLEKLSYFMKRLGIFLVMVALIVGMVGCWGVSSPSESYIPIWDWYDLNDIRDNLGGSYILMTDLNQYSDGYPGLAGPKANGGKGWEPIGTEFNPFKGWFDGQEYEVRDLVINRRDQNHVGLFGYSKGTIEDISVVNATVTGKQYVGGLVGRNDRTVSNSLSTGSVTGVRVVGGLVGWNAYGQVTSNSRSTCSVTGTANVGGLVGWNEGIVSNSYSTGSVKGEDHVGGLTGYNHLVKGIVSGSHSSGSVTGTDYVGGLVGANDQGEVSSNSYSTGSVAGKRVVGGLVGWNAHGEVSDSHSTGDVTGEKKVGGLVGHNSDGKVSDSYSIGSVTGEEDVGGLVGRNDGIVSISCYYTGSVTVTGTD